MFGIAVTIYLFLAGIGAGLYLVSYIIDLAYMPRVNKPRDLSLLYQKIQIVALASVGAGSLFLMADLTRPEQFLLVFRRLGTSILSLGALFIALFMCVVALRIAHQWTSPRSSRLLAPVLDIGAALLSVGVILYTGFFLMQMRAVPLWQSWLVVALFAASSISSGLALFVLLAAMSLRRRRIPRAASDALVADRIALLVESIFLVAYIAWGLTGEPAAREACMRLVYGDLAWTFWALVVFGLVTPLVIGVFLQHRRMGLLLLVECLCVVAGCFLLRYCIMASSVRSFALG